MRTLGIAAIALGLAACSHPMATTPEAVGEAIVRGLAKGSEVVHVPPLLRVVFSGLRHLPRPVFRRMPIQ